MTIGENIRRIRKERGLTLKQLGEAIGVSEAYIRAYETGRRNPKQKSLEALAYALHVNVEALTGASFDGIKAMHMLFQIFRQYGGELFEIQDTDGNYQTAITFNTLILMSSWYERYEKYLDEVKECEKIKDVSERGTALIKAEERFNLWMDVYPEYETWKEKLDAQKHHDEFKDFIGLNPKNEY